MLFYERLTEDDAAEQQQSAIVEQSQSQSELNKDTSAEPAPAATAAADTAAASAAGEVEGKNHEDEKAEKKAINCDETIMNPEVQQIIVQENASARMKSYLFSPDFSTFVWDLANKWKVSINEVNAQSLIDQEQDIVDTECLAFGLFLRVMYEVVTHGANRDEILPSWELNLVEMLRNSRRVSSHLLFLLTRNPDFMRSVFIDSPQNETRVHLVHAIIVAIRELEKEESNDMLTTSNDDLEQEAKGLAESLQGFTKTDVWCKARLADSMMHPSYIPLFVKLAMDLWYFIATSNKPYSSQMFFALFLELAKIGPIERRLLCDRLAFFDKAALLLSHKVPAMPLSMPTFSTSVIEDNDDEPDEKDIIPTSGFAELYGIKKKEKPKANKQTFVGASNLREFDMIYLLEALTVIIQNAQLPPFEAPPPLQDETQSKKSKKADKKTDKKAKEEEDLSKSAADESTVAPAAQAAAASASSAAHAMGGMTDAEVHLDQLNSVITNVLPNMIRKCTGAYAVKQFVLKLATANSKVIQQLHPMFYEFLSRPCSSAARQLYSEIVHTILNVRDGASERRLSDYMTLHMEIIHDLVRNEHRAGPLLAEPLEALAAVVNSGSKEVKDEYKKAATEILTSHLQKEGGFTPSYP